MTVAELIEKLRACPQDMQVVIGDQGEPEVYHDPEIGEGWIIMCDNGGSPCSVWERFDIEDHFLNETGTLAVIIDI